MSGWLFLALLALILAAIAAVGVWFESYISHEGWPRRYRSRHRWGMHTPSPAHPARRAAYIDMCRVTLHDPAVDAEIAWLEELFAKDAAG